MVRRRHCPGSTAVLETKEDGSSGTIDLNLVFIQWNVAICYVYNNSDYYRRCREISMHLSESREEEDAG